MKETDEIMGMIKEEGAAYFARERGNKVEVGLYLEHLIEERGMKKKDVVRELNLEESYARKLFGGQRIPTRKILLQCAFLLSLDLSDTPSTTSSIFYMKPSTSPPCVKSW